MRPLSPLTALFATMLLASDVFAGSTPAVAVSPKALQLVRLIAVQHDGRHKPFDSFAMEILAQVTGAPRIGRADPVATVLSIMAEPERWQDAPLLSIPFVPLREALGMSRKATHASYNELIASRKLMRLLPDIVAKQQRDEKLSMLENETMDAFQRFVSLSRLFEQHVELVPPPEGSPDRSWLPILQPQGYAAEPQLALRNGWTGLIEAIRSGEASSVEASAAQLAQVLRAANPSAYPASWRLRLEVFYNHAGPFRIARVFYLIGAIGFLLSLMARARWGVPTGWGGLVAGYAIHGAGIAMRVVLGGRPPVSNFFETMLWLPFVAVTLGLIFERLYRIRYAGLGAALLAALTLFLADYVPLDSSIVPVVAVLRSNLWLTVHVLTIVASYGALALATVAAHVYGTLYLMGGRKHPALIALDLYLYRTIQVGVVLLAGGVMLGAVWANASWGRYWGWDPKETWALITLLWFLAILHGRFAGWIRGVGVALSTIGGFLLLLVTYYGVSFYLVGLHSYAGGHAKPLPSLLIGYLVLEAVFVAWVAAAALRRRVA